MDENGVLILKGDCQQDVNVDYEKNLGNCLYDGVGMLWWLTI